MRRFPALVATLILAATSAALFADGPAPAPAAPPSAGALSPAMESALRDFASDDYKTRTAAFAKLQLALGAQLRDLVSSNDPEVLSRLGDIMQSNEALSRWVTDTLKLSPDQRKAQFAFGLKPEFLPVVALAYSADAQKRADAAHALAKIDDPEADNLLATLLQDPERRVYIAAMETAYDRKPADPVIDALWERAVQAGLAPYGGASAGGGTPITFRGRTLTTMALPDLTFMGRRRDADLATEVLAHLNPPQLVKKLQTFLDNYNKARAGDNPSHLMYQATSEPFRNVIVLIVASKSKELIPDLYKLAVAPRTHTMHIDLGAKKLYWTNRTCPIAAMITVAGLKPDDYNLNLNPRLLGQWTVSGPDDEALAMKDIHQWYVANVDKDAPAPDPEATAPEYPNMPRNGNDAGAQGRGGVIIQKGAPPKMQGPANAPPAPAPATQN